MKPLTLASKTEETHRYSMDLFFKNFPTPINRIGLWTGMIKANF